MNAVVTVSGVYCALRGLDGWNGLCGSDGAYGLNEEYGLRGLGVMHDSDASNGWYGSEYGSEYEWCYDDSAHARPPNANDAKVAFGVVEPVVVAAVDAAAVDAVAGDVVGGDFDDDAAAVVAGVETGDE